MLAQNTLAVAGGALFFRDLAGAVAGRADALHRYLPEDRVLGFVHAAFAAAHGAGLKRSPRLAAGAAAGVAGAHFGQQDFALGAKDRLLERYFEVDRNVAAAARATSTTEEVAHGVAEVEAESVLEYVLKLREVEALPIKAARASVTASKGLAIGVILSALLVVGQH